MSQTLFYSICYLQRVFIIQCGIQTYLIYLTKRNCLLTMLDSLYLTTRDFPKCGCPSRSCSSTPDAEISFTSDRELFSRGLIGLFLASSSPEHSTSVYTPKSRRIYLGVRTEFEHAGLCVHRHSLVFGMDDLRSLISIKIMT